jgi:Spy/CpxP family protein refolding chaperone
MLTRILFTGLLASTLTFAQRGGGGRGGGESNMANVSFSGTRIDRLADTLKLTKDQKRDIKAAMDDAQKLATPIHEEMVQSRLAIAEAVAAGKSQADLDKVIHGHAELDAQLTSLELHTFAKIVDLLEAEQKPRGVPVLFAMVKGAFNGKNWNTDQQSR